MFNAIKFLNLVFILLITSIAHAEPDMLEVAPIWKGFDVDKNDTESEGFTPPPPTVAPVSESAVNLLKAEISPRTPQVQSGETITFTATTNQQGLSYYWKSGSQSSTQADFAFNTRDLAPGKYRILLTVTNRDRDQAHSYTTVNVIVLNSVEISTPSAVDSKSVAVSVPSNVSSASVLAPTPDVSNTPVVASIPEIPSPPVIAPIPPKVVEKVVPLIAVPNLMGKSIAQTYALLKQSELAIGRIEERAVTSSPGLIIEQLPKSGSQVSKNTVINLVVSVRAAVAVPNVEGLALERAKALLARKQLVVTPVIERVNEAKVGLVIEQYPLASTTIDVGSSVSLVIGKHAVFAPKLSIKASTLTLEAGDALNLSAIISPPHLAKGVTYQWQLGSYKGDKANFNISQLHLKPKRYHAELTVRNSRGETASLSQPITVIKSSPVMPNVMGMSLEEVKKSLSFVNKDKLTITKEEAAISHSQIVQQSPGAGDKVTPTTEVKLVLAYPKPSLLLNLSTNTPQLGDVVSLTAELTSSSQEENRHYIFHINDKQHAQVQPRYDWTPKAAGRYELSVSAYSDEGLITTSQAVTLMVADKWDQPIAMIVPATQTVVQGEVVEFSSTSTYDIKSSLSYQWLSDNGSRSTSKNITIDTSKIAAGTYTVRLNIVDSRNNTASEKATLIIKPKPVATKHTGDSTTIKVPPVTSSAQVAQKTKETKITLKASRKFVSTGTAVNFNMTEASSDKAQYFYNFDDDSVMQWGESSQVAHKFSSFGTYQVRGGVKIDGQIYRAPAVSVWVWSSGLLYIVFGIAAFVFLLMWWWTKHIPDNKKQVKQPPIIAEEQVPLSDIDRIDRTANQQKGKTQRSLRSTLLRGFMQLIIGVLISAIIIYFILKGLGLT